VAASSAHCRPSAAPLPRVACLSAAHFVHLNRLPAATAHSCWATLVLAAVSEGGSEKEQTQAMERLRYGAARLLAPCTHDHARGLAASALGRRRSVCMANAKFCLWWSLPQWCKCGSAHRPIPMQQVLASEMGLRCAARRCLRKHACHSALSRSGCKRSSSSGLQSMCAPPRACCMLHVVCCGIQASGHHHLSKCGPILRLPIVCTRTLMLM
jgi:hypothetical protein